MKLRPGTSFVVRELAVSVWPDVRGSHGCSMCGEFDYLVIIEEHQSAHVCHDDGTAEVLPRDATSLAMLCSRCAAGLAVALLEAVTL